MHQVIFSLPVIYDMLKWKTEDMVVMMALSQSHPDDLKSHFLVNAWTSTLGVFPVIVIAVFQVS